MAGVQIRPRNIPAVPYYGIEWTSDIRNMGTLALAISQFRVNFAFLKIVGGGTFLTNISSFAGFVNAPGQAGPTSGTNLGALFNWSAQSDLSDVAAATSVKLFDVSAGPAFVDLTTAASNATTGDLPMPAETGDILYIGHATTRTNAGLKYERDIGAGLGVAAVGGDPLIVEYSAPDGVWRAVSQLSDGTSAFGTSGHIGFERPADWTLATVDGVSAYWVRLRLTANPSTPGVGSRLRVHRDVDGYRPLLDPDLGTPKLRHHYLNIDALGGTGVQVTSQSSITLPALVRWRAMRVGRVRSRDSYKLFRNGVTGLAQTLDATRDGAGYAVWKVSNELGGVWRDVGLYFFPWTRGQSLSPPDPGPLEFFNEWPLTSYPSFPTLADNPCEIRYRGIRAFDGTSWHELLDWRVTQVVPVADPLTYGYSAQVEPGSIVSLTSGAAGYCENVVNKWILSGLLYERGDDGTALAAAGYQEIAAGSATLRGPTWGGAPPLPRIQQEDDLGHYVLRPRVGTAARVVFVAARPGRYTVQGDFARQNDTLNSGDGVDVKIVRERTNATLFSAGIESSEAIVPATPFAGPAGVRHFDLTIDLEAGERIRFEAHARADETADETAFRLTRLSFVDLHSRALGERRPRHSRNIDHPASGDPYRA